MSYIINKTDGTVLTEVVDGTIDQTSTDITLVGKNASTYGEFFNENFIHILENFANTSQPNHPITGQLWFDTTEGRLKVYDGAGFKVSGGTIVSNTIPSSIAQGDIWIDSARQQLYFNVGSGVTLLAGPQYTSSQGVSGFNIIDVVDTFSVTHTVVLLYVSQVLLGLFSKDAFTPADPIPGYTGDVKVGFNVSSDPDVKFNVTASSADTLLSSDGSFKTTDSFVSSTDTTATMVGTLAIANPTPLILGASNNNSIVANSNVFSINSSVKNQNFQVNTLNDAGLLPSIHVSTATSGVGIYTDQPTSTLDVNGDVRVRGSLLVEGATTTINATNLEVEDSLIELGKTTSPTDVTATGGGIKLKGDTDKTITWSSSNWVSSENINLASGKVYKVNGFDVLSQTSLGLTVTSAPGLTSIGALGFLQVDNITVNDSTIAYSNAVITDGTITLAPKNAGTVDVSSKKITSLATPTSATDATNKTYVDTKVRLVPLGLSADTTGLSNAQIAANIISKIYPVAEHENGTLCRIWCTISGVGQGKLYTLTSGTWTWSSDL